jgi:copper chaperone CopZ
MSGGEMSNMTHDCHVERVEPTTSHPERAVASARLLVEGMGCPRCAIRVQNALVRLDGVAAAYISLYPPLGTVRYDPERLSVDDLLNAVATAGQDSKHIYLARALG